MIQSFWRCLKRLANNEWIYLLGAFVVGFFILFLIEKFVTETITKSALTTVTSSLVIGFVLSLLTNKIFYNDIIDRMAAATNCSKDSLKMGLEKVTSRWDTIDYKTLIDNSQTEITIFVIYCESFINKNINELQNFLQKSTATLTFIILDESASMVNELDKKFHHGGNILNTLSGKINTSIDAVKRLDRSGRQGKIKLISHEYPPSYALYRFDNKVVVTTYNQEPGRSNIVPTFVFDKTDDNNDLFHFFIKDIPSFALENPQQSKQKGVKLVYESK